MVGGGSKCCPAARKKLLSELIYDTIKGLSACRSMMKTLCKHLSLDFPTLSDDPVCGGKNWVKGKEHQQKGAHSKNVMMMMMMMMMNLK